MKLAISVETPLSRSTRVQQLAALFDVPLAEKSRLSWEADLPLEDQPWRIGLLVGPSGSGKSTILSHLFGAPPPLTWNQPAVIDDFAPQFSIHDIASVCQAVGFNTIPAWLRPYRVLSNGEKFRVEIARRLLETPPDQVIVLDEFTSVVDRQVARITSWAVHKWIHRHERRLVAATCHYDVLDWLQPDWVFEPALAEFSRGRKRRRPPPERASGFAVEL